MQMAKFPMKFEEYCILGFEAFDQKNYRQAIDLLESAYKIKPDHELHRMMVLAYFELHEYQEAKNLIREEVQSYVNSDDDSELYFEILCKNHDWIEAWQLFYKKNCLKKQRKKLESLENAYSITNEEEFKQLQSKLMQASNEDKITQITIWQQAKKLPSSLYIETVLPNLINAELTIIVRSELLDTLRELRYNATVQYLDLFGNIDNINPHHLCSMTDNIKYQQFINYITDLTKKIPTLAEHLKHLLPMFYYLLLPNVSLNLEYPKQTAELLLKNYGVTVTEEIDEQKYHQCYEVISLVQQQLL